MPEHGYVSGDPWAECDSCHFVVRRSAMRRRWDGFLVCTARCWEPRPEAERPRTPKDRIAVPNARPDPYAGQYSNQLTDHDGLAITSGGFGVENPGVPLEDGT